MPDKGPCFHQGKKFPPGHTRAAHEMKLDIEYSDTEDLALNRIDNGVRDMSTFASLYHIELVSAGGYNSSGKKMDSLAHHI